MTTPGVPTTTPHIIVSLGPPRPLSTESCTNTINSSEYGYGCVSSPTCAAPLVLSTDTTTDLYGVPLLICVSTTSGSVQPGGPVSTDSLSMMTSINPGGPISSATVSVSTSTSINPGGLMSSATSPSSTSSVQPGGPLSSTTTSSGISPSGIASASLQHSSLTEPLSTVSGSGTTTSTRTGTSTSSSSSTSSTASANGAIAINAGLGDGSLMSIVMLCWMGVWGWRTLRGRL